MRAFHDCLPRASSTRAVLGVIDSNMERSLPWLICNIVILVYFFLSSLEIFIVFCFAVKNQGKWVKHFIDNMVEVTC